MKMNNSGISKYQNIVWTKYLTTGQIIPLSLICLNMLLELKQGDTNEVHTHCELVFDFPMMYLKFLLCTFLCKFTFLYIPLQVYLYRIYSMTQIKY